MAQYIIALKLILIVRFKFKKIFLPMFETSWNGFQ